MNKQELLSLAQRRIDERRYAAEEKPLRVLETLRQNDEWAQTERLLRAKQVECAMNGKVDRSETDALQQKLDALTQSLGYDPQNDLTPHYCCERCNDTGYVQNERCVCLQKEICNLLVADSNVPDKNFTFENSSETDKHNKTVYNTAKKLCLSDKRNLLLLGKVGSGKTYLLAACANLCAQLGKSTLFVTAYALNNAFLNTHLQGAESRETLMDNLVETDVLIIDDLGTENIYKNVTAEYLFVLLNERLTQKKQTFVSTNLSLTDIRKKYDDRIFSRLVDQNSTVIAELTGADKRFSHK